MKALLRVDDGYDLDSAMPPKRKSWRSVKVALAVLVAIAIAGVIAFFQFQRTAIRHFYAYAGYANALTDFIDERHALPSSLADLEQSYGAKPYRRADLPPPAPYPRPRLYARGSGGTNTSLLILSPPAARVWGVYDLRITLDSTDSPPRVEFVFRYDPASYGWRLVE